MGCPVLLHRKRCRCLERVCRDGNGNSQPKPVCPPEQYRLFVVGMWAILRIGDALCSVCLPVAWRSCATDLDCLCWCRPVLWVRRVRHRSHLQTRWYTTGRFRSWSCGAVSGRCQPLPVCAEDFWFGRKEAAGGQVAVI